MIQARPWPAAEVGCGARLASFFWVESLVRSSEQRQLLFDMDQHVMRLRAELGETHTAVIGLTGTHHNLLRQWADTRKRMRKRRAAPSFLTPSGGLTRSGRSGGTHKQGA